MTRYCAHQPCSKQIKQRSNELAQDLERRTFCSSYCSDRKPNAPVPHGSLRGYSFHWHRDEPACDRCQLAVDRELLQMQESA